MGVLDQCRGHASFVLHPLASSPSPPRPTPSFPFAFPPSSLSSTSPLGKSSPRDSRRKIHARLTTWKNRPAMINPLGLQLEIQLLSQTGFPKKPPPPFAVEIINSTLRSVPFPLPLRTPIFSLRSKYNIRKITIITITIILING